MQVVLPPKLLPCKEIRCVFSNSTLATAHGNNCYGYLIIVNHFDSSIITDSHPTTLQLCGSKPWSSRWNATSNACCSSGKQSYRVTLCPRTFSPLKCTICPLLPQIMCIVFLSKLSYRAAYAKGWVGGGLGEVSVAIEHIALRRSGNALHFTKQFLGHLLNWIIHLAPSWTGLMACALLVLLIPSVPQIVRLAQVSIQP